MIVRGAGFCVPEADNCAARIDLLGMAATLVLTSELEGAPLEPLMQ